MKDLTELHNTLRVQFALACLLNVESEMGKFGKNRAAEKTTRKERAKTRKSYKIHGNMKNTPIWREYGKHELKKRAYGFIGRENKH